MQALQKALGYTFRDQSHLRRALTHPSTKQPDNQRLEFLGDAILEFCVSDMLYQKYTDFQEGALTARRAALVCERTLSVLAHSLDLGRCLVMGNGEAMTGGREKPSILADAVEAVLAAVYVDGGYQAVREVIFRLFQDEDKLVSPRVKDDKSSLQEYTQAHDMGLPAYRIIEASGPDHDRRFVAEVLIQGQQMATGEGSSKKSAEQMAARMALRRCQSKE